MLLYRCRARNDTQHAGSLVELPPKLLAGCKHRVKRHVSEGAAKTTHLLLRSSVVRSGNNIIVYFVILINHLAIRVAAKENLEDMHRGRVPKHRAILSQFPLPNIDMHARAS